MFKGIADRWEKFNQWWENYVTRKPYTITRVIAEENEIDKIEIEQAERTIVNHQYLKHMAEGRIKARAEWQRLQGEAHGNVRPISELENARKHRQA